MSNCTQQCFMGSLVQIDFQSYFNTMNLVQKFNQNLMYDTEDHNNLTYFYTYQKKASLTSFMHYQYMNLHMYHYSEKLQVYSYLFKNPLTYVKAPIVRCSAQSCTRKDTHMAIWPKPFAQLSSHSTIIEPVTRSITTYSFDVYCKLRLTFLLKLRNASTYQMWL